MKMSQRKRHVLKQLCTCHKGEGILLSGQMKRAGETLIKEGLAYTIYFGPIEIFMVTPEGRQAL